MEERGADVDELRGQRLLVAPAERGCVEREGRSPFEQRLVLVPEDSGRDDVEEAMLARFGRVRVVEARGRLLEKITRRIDTGELKPVVGQVVPLERIRDAFTAKAGGGVPGKVVLKVGGDSV